MFIKPIFSALLVAGALDLFVPKFELNLKFTKRFLVLSGIFTATYLTLKNNQ